MVFKATGVDELTKGESKEKGIHALLEELTDICKLSDRGITL